MAENKSTTTTDVIPVEEAKENLLKMIKEVKGSKKRYLLSLQGRPQAVVLGFDDYLRSILRSRRSRIVTRIQKEAKARGLDKLTLKDIDYETRIYRKEKK